MMLALKLLIWLVPIGINIWADRTGRKPNYALTNIIRGMVAFLHWYILVPASAVPWTMTGKELLIIMIPIWLFEVTSFWLIFDIGVNFFQKPYLPFWERVFYFDHKEGDSGWTDRFFKWAGRTWYIVAKIAALIVMVLSIMLLYQRG